MKNLLKLIVLLALNNVLNAQNNNQINVSTPNTNVLCVGLDNYINIESKDGKTHDYVLELYNCSGFCVDPDFKTLGKYEDAIISKAGAQRYNIHINRKTSNALLLIKEKVDGKFIECGLQHYKVSFVPKPILDFGNAYMQFGAMDLNQLKKLKNLKVKLENLVRTDISYKVVSYKFMAVGRKTGGPKFAMSIGESLDPIKSILNVLVPGDIIQFSDIKVVGPGNQVLFIENFSTAMDGGLKGIYREFDEQVKLDSINNLQYKLSNDIDYGRNAKLTKSSLVKNLVEYYKYQIFESQNPFFKKNLLKYEFKNGRFEKYEFNESFELRLKNGLVFIDSQLIFALNPDVDPDNYDASDPSNFHEAILVTNKNSRLSKIYFDEILNNLTNIKEWYLFAEYNQRTIAIPVSEFSKERVIFPQVIASYLDYVKKNSARQYEKYRVFHNQRIYIDSITKGRINFFESVAEHQLSKMYYKLITGTNDGFYDVFGGNKKDDLYLNSWGKLLDWNNFKPLTNYAPEWYHSDSILSFSSTSISHSALIKSIQEIIASEDKITGMDREYHYIPFNISGFDVLSKINADGSTSSLLMVKIVLEVMELNIDNNFYIPVSKVFGLFDDVEKIMISDIYKFGYFNMEFIKN